MNATTITAYLAPQSTTTLSVPWAIFTPPVSLDLLIIVDVTQTIPQSSLQYLSPTSPSYQSNLLTFVSQVQKIIPNLYVGLATFVRGPCASGDFPFRLNNALSQPNQALYDRYVAFLKV